MRRLNVQSGLRKGKVKKCCGHQVRALLSVIVGTEKCLREADGPVEKSCDAPFGWKGGRPGVCLDVGRVRSKSPKTISDMEFAWYVEKRF